MHVEYENRVRITLLIHMYLSDIEYEQLEPFKYISCVGKYCWHSVPGENVGQQNFLFFFFLMGPRNVPPLFLNNPWPTFQTVPWFIWSSES